MFSTQDVRDIFAAVETIPITPEDAICHPERSEGSPSNIEIPHYARNDSVRILKSNGYMTH